MKSTEAQIAAIRSEQPFKEGNMTIGYIRAEGNRGVCIAITSIGPRSIERILVSQNLLLVAVATFLNLNLLTDFGCFIYISLLLLHFF